MFKTRISLFSVETFCLTVPKDFVRELSCVSKKILSEINYTDNRSYHDFPSRIFCPRVPNILAVERSFVSENFWYGKKFMDEIWDITIFCGNFFVPQYLKLSLGNTSVFQKISVIENFYVYEGDITILRSTFFVSECRKTS